VIERGSSGPDPAHVVIHRRIEWVDTDAAGRWHFLTAFRLFEAAETTLWEELGGMEQLGDLPRVHVEVDFRRPLHYRDRIETEVRIEKVGRASLTYGFEVRRDDTVCGEGKVVIAVVAGDGKIGCIPDDVRRRLLTAGRLRPDLVPFSGEDPERTER
jgi:acyl-CoA thioesterase FadM